MNRTKSILILLFLFACAKPLPYVASKASIERALPGREIIPAWMGCDVCHKFVADRHVYKYYPVKISHKVHAGLGIDCVFCHRKATASTQTDDYLMPEGHGFSDGTLDKNPCKICHNYSSEEGKRDRRIKADCKTCHSAYSSGKPLQFRWLSLYTNLKNSHKTHYNKGLHCLRCHVGFDQVEDLVPNYIPKMDLCRECHGAKEEKGGAKEQKGTDALDGARQLFKRNCAMCHGPEGKGNGTVATFIGNGIKVRDLTDHEYMSRRTDGDLFMAIFEGGQSSGLSEKMPAFKGLLSGGDVVMLIKYIRHISGS